MTELLSEPTPFWVACFVGWVFGIFTMIALWALICVMEREEKRSQTLWMDE